jgi:hypothetical protein
MTHPTRKGVLNLLGAMLLTGSLAAGPWEPLFNGKDLTGWKQVNGTAPYVVEGDAIVGTTIAGSPNSFLATEENYGDFIFECEVKQDVGPSNSGIMFRALSTPDYMKGRVHGYQMELESTARAWAGGIYDEARRGWFYPGDLNPAAQKAYVYGEWNKLRIEAIGTSLRTWINGIAVAHVVDGMTPAGFIALQVHGIGDKPENAGRRIAWRNLRIQTGDLAPSPGDETFIRNMVPNTLTEAERAQGWRMLWDGRTTQGWRSAKGTDFPATGWSTADGALTVLGTKGEAKGGDIVTAEEFATFELQLEFQMTEGANSGIKYFVAPDEKGAPVGHEFQLIDDERHPDAKAGVDGNRTTASLYDLIPRGKLPGGAAIKPEVGKWQHARIVVAPAGHVEHWLNGIKVVEYERGSADFAARVARSKYAKIPGFGQGAKGSILLQDHGDVVKFRSIKIRPL